MGDIFEVFNVIERNVGMITTDMPSSRIEKLEAVVRAALRLRRMMEDLGEPTLRLLVPRTEVIRFDKVMKEQSDEQIQDKAV